eukprot:9487087-Pyramimonas_sp.AAC.1
MIYVFDKATGRIRVMPAPRLFALIVAAETVTLAIAVARRSVFDPCSCCSSPSLSGARGGTGV